MSKGIYGKPYVNLDKFCNVDELNDIFEDINYGISLSHKNIRATHTIEPHNEFDRGDVNSVLNYFKHKEKNEKILKYGNDLLKKDKQAFLYFITYQYKNCCECLNYLVLKEFIDLKNPNKVEAQKCNKEAKESGYVTKWNDDIKNFPSFKKWLDKLPFDELDNVYFLLKQSGHPIGAHKDFIVYEDDNFEEKWQWIFVDPTRNRRLWIDFNGERLEMPGICNYFNTYDLHGGVNSNYDSPNWAIRIEGRFNKEVLDYIKQ